MARETAAQKKARVSALLAEYDARTRELNKLTTIVKGLKEQVREIPAGGYGEWELTFGTPREILDQGAVKAAYRARGEDLPMVSTQAPIVVTPKIR